MYCETKKIFGKVLRGTCIQHMRIQSIKVVLKGFLFDIGPEILEGIFQGKLDLGSLTAENDDERCSKAGFNLKKVHI